jgi:hypothetical protein
MGVIITFHEHGLRRKVELERGNSAKGRHPVLWRASVACIGTSQGVRVIDVIKMHNNVFAYASMSSIADQ